MFFITWQFNRVLHIKKNSLALSDKSCFMRKIVLFIALLLPSVIFSQPFTKNYIMSFHTCDAACVGFQDHLVNLAESDDGSTWTLVPNFTPYSGSVPDVITRGSKLYVYTPGMVRRYDNSSGTWDTNPVPVSIVDNFGNSVSYVDPSAIIDSSGNIVLFFLNSTGLTGDPASCSPYPCDKNFDSAVEVSGSDGTQFIKQSGNRRVVNITSGTASDPDIYFDGTNYILYVSRGSNTNAYSGSSMHGSYSSISGLPSDVLTSQGGIPCGYYNSSSNEYWTYVHANSGGSVVVKQAVHSTISSQPATFNTVVSGPIIGEPSTTKTESPGFCENLLTTGIHVNESSPSVQFQFPNPVQEEWGGSVISQLDQAVVFTITDVTGKEMLSTRINLSKGKNTLLFDKHEFGSGIYFMRIVTSDEKVYSQKLVVVK